jgi:hypothetical protein
MPATWLKTGVAAAVAEGGGPAPEEERRAV